MYARFVEVILRLLNWTTGSLIITFCEFWDLITFCGYRNKSSGIFHFGWWSILVAREKSKHAHGIHFAFLFQTTLIDSISRWDESGKGEFLLSGSTLVEVPTSAEEVHLLGLGTFQRWNTISWCMLLYFTPELQAFEEDLHLSQSWEVDGSVHMEICAVVCGAVWSVSEGHCWGKRFFASLQPSGSLKQLMTHWEWRPPPPSKTGRTHLVCTQNLDGVGPLWIVARVIKLSPLCLFRDWSCLKIVLKAKLRNSAVHRSKAE